VQKNFLQLVEGWNLFVFLALLRVLYVASAAVCWCSVVRFNIVCGAFLHGLWCAFM